MKNNDSNVNNQNKICEQLSAFLDGELHQDELSLLIKQIDKQPDLLAQAQQVQQTKLCLQGDSPRQSLGQANNFTLKIHNAIHAEDYPEWENIQSAAGSYDDINVANHSSLSKTTTSLKTSAYAANDPIWRRWVGGGVAAAVALLAVNFWQQPGTSFTFDDSAMNISAASSLSVPVDTVQINNDENESLSLTDEITPLPDSLLVAETSDSAYTVPRYISAESTDSTSAFLRPGDLQRISFDQFTNSRDLRFSLASPDYSLFDTQRMLIRMREAESHSQQLLNENLLLRQQLLEQQEIIRNYQELNQ